MRSTRLLLVVLAAAILPTADAGGGAMKQPKAVGLSGHLWCHVGTKKDFAPTQCDKGVEECFSFRCDGGQHDFFVRGCGISMLTSGTGLPNESCFQAQTVCQYLGGASNCSTCAHRHMCNNSNLATKALPFLASILTLLLLAAC